MDPKQWDPASRNQTNRDHYAAFKGSLALFGSSRPYWLPMLLWAGSVGTLDEGSKHANAGASWASVLGIGIMIWGCVLLFGYSGLHEMPASKRSGDFGDFSK